MKTGDEYRASIRDGRKTYIDGELITDPATHPVLRVAVDEVAETYDRFYMEYKDQGYSPPFIIPTTVEDMDRRSHGLDKTDITCSVTAAAFMALVSVAPEMAALNPEYKTRIDDYVAFCRENDIRAAECITDAKGNRKLHPSKQPDPDMYVHVVDRNDDGIFVTGAKQHISGAGVAHELIVMPTKTMRPGEEEYAVAFAVPVNAPGVKIVNVTPAPRSGDTRHYPQSSKKTIPEGYVIFDNVFVPYSRVFLDGEVSHSTTLAHSLGLWERSAVLSHAGDRADMLVGLACLLAQANGTEALGHVRQKLALMAIHATMVHAGWEAALKNATVNEDGTLSPSALYISATKYYQSELAGKMTDYLHDIAGNLTVNAPTMADYDNEELRSHLDEYLSTPGFSAEERLRLFHYLRDTTADTGGGRSAVVGQLAGGGQHAQRLVTLKHFDMDQAVAKARDAVGI